MPLLQILSLGLSAAAVNNYVQSVSSYFYRTWLNALFVGTVFVGIAAATRLP